MKKVDFNEIGKAVNFINREASYKELLNINPLFAEVYKEIIENNNGVLDTAIFTLSENGNVLSFKYKKNQEMKVISTKDEDIVM